MKYKSPEVVKIERRTITMQGRYGRRKIRRCYLYLRFDAKTTKKLAISEAIARALEDP